MGKLSTSEVLHIAKLSKLTLSEEEVKKYQDQLSKVVNYVSELSEVDTSKVEPTSQTTGLENIFRTDEVKNENCLNQDEALSGTENVENGLFKVKVIIPEEVGK